MKQNLLWGLLALTLIGILASFIVRPSETAPTFYYSYNRKVPLFAAPNQVVITYATDQAQSRAGALVEALAVGNQVRWRNAKTAVVSTTTPSAATALLSKMLGQAEVLTTMPLYTLDSGAPMAITNEFGVKYPPTASTAQIAALAEKTGSTIVRSVGAGLVILSVPKGGNALATANLYQESGLVEFAHPNFLMDFVRHQTAPNDEFYPRQFYLHNTGQVIADGHTGNPGADIKAPEAWGLTLGSANITVAILDDGVSANHPDLPNSRQVRLANSNFSGRAMSMTHRR